MARETLVLVVGSGGHAAVVVDLIEAAPGFAVGGVCDEDAARQRGDLLGYHVGPLPAAGGEFPVVIAIGDNDDRRAVAGRLTSAGFRFAPPLVHPRATVSRHAYLGGGTVVFAGSIINARAQIGSQVVVNTSASIDHDCLVEDFVHITPGACLGGGVVVETGSIIGTGAVVIPGRRVGAGTIVGAGATVVRDLPANCVAFGNPARVVRSR